MSDQQRKLLIVDDDVHIRRLLRLYLRDTPYEILEAATAEEAEAAFQKHELDVVLLDLVLPYFGGFALCQRIKAAPKSPYVIMMTGETSPETREQANECGVDEFLAKPFNPGEVRSRLIELARRGIS